MNSIEQIQQALKNYLKQEYALSEERLNSIDITLTHEEQKQQFGDMSTNAPLVLAKLLKKNPRELAQHIVNQFSHPLVARKEVAGAGFVNLFLTPEAFSILAKELFEKQDSFFSGNSLVKKQNYSIEFVSANPTGPLHLGHGRGGIIGDVLGNIIRFVGHNVTKEFYINDAGAQIAKLGHSLRVRCEQLLEKQATLPEDGYHGEYLVELARHCIEEYGSQVLEKSDLFFATYAKDHLLQKIKETLAAYGINFDVWFSEKTLRESSAITEALEKLTKNGFIYEKEDALWFKSTAFGDDKDRVVKRANGEFTYVAPDIAYLENKLHRGADHLIMILGQDHHSYVVRLKAVMEALGQDPQKLDVILYQLVTLKESGEQVRMSKRAGRIVSLEDVIETVGRDVARFFYLNRKADAHLEFDIDLALKHTEENPVYYIQYAYVRTGSILAKAQEHTALSNISGVDSQNLGTPEALLLKKIIYLKTLLQSITKNYQTHLLTYYVLELAQAFHHYYAHNRVIDPHQNEQSRSRLLLVLLTRQTIKLCLRLLGISAPDSM